jgi:hypothetical protein
VSVAGISHFHVQIDGIEIESVRPGRRSDFDEHPREVFGCLERLDPWPAFGDHVGQIADTLAAVCKSQP